jgi:hypothetical protein
MPLFYQLSQGRILPTHFRPPAPAVFTTAIQFSACGRSDAGAIPAASTFSERASTSDSSRHLTPNDNITEQVATHYEAGDSRQQSASSVLPRPHGATECATRPVAEYPDLAAVVMAWPELPQAVRAAIAAMVRATDV